MKRETRELIAANAIGALIAFGLLGLGILIWEVLR